MEELKTYWTIDKPVSCEVTEKGSKFIALLFPVKNDSDIKDLLQQVKTQHPKARHWCYAWRLGIDGHLFRATDDGEPSGTAGRPILNQIDSAELTNVLLIVVRYFGGILLGTSGLIKAYKEAAKRCIVMSLKHKFESLTDYQIFADPSTIQMLLGIFKELKIDIINYTIDLQSNIVFQLPLETEEMYFKKIKSKLEKTNLNQIENPRQLKNCILSKWNP